MGQRANNEFKRMQIIKIKRIVLIFVIVLLVSIPVFLYFYIMSQGRIALREAKNAKLAIEMLDIEYYGKGSTVYDPSRADGLAKGVQAKVIDLVGKDGRVVLTAYNKKTREVVGFYYSNEHYQVFYTNDKENGSDYKVSYLLPILD